MRDLLQFVSETVRGRRLFAEGQPILVAVSGGVDSMVLLHLLHALSKKNKWKLTVAHLNHRLRGRQSGADERLVRRTAAALKLPLVLDRADVRSLSRRTKLSLEMAARRARHEFLAHTAVRLGIRAIALAHHADDQLELFLVRLLRGSGSQGLAGMKWKNPSPVSREVHLVRPLLAVSKADLRGYARAGKLCYREDASNACLDMVRNRIRHELLPLLKRRYQPALAEVVRRTVEILAAESAFVESTASQWLHHRQKAETSSGQKHLAFDGLHPAVQRRVIQSQLIGLGVVADFELTEKLRLSPRVPVSLGSPGLNSSNPNELACLSVLRDPSGVLHLKEQVERSDFASGSLSCDLDARGRVYFEGLTVRWSEQKALPARLKHLPGKELFDADTVGSPIILRHWRPGDRFQPIGMRNPVKLQDFFTNEKVPAAIRRQLILATTAGGEIFWVEGLRIAERFKLTNRTIRLLNWAWQRL